MSIVQPALDGALVLDLFAGSGALGLEALSRGARRADFVEQAPPSLRLLARNVAALGAEAQSVVHRADAVRFAEKLAPGAYDVAFADPPYEQGLAHAVAACWIRSPFAAILGVEHGLREELPAGGDTRRYGDTAITFYRQPHLHPDLHE
jgi:16S rRNA (guanine966-N2)-methyltransferase